MTEKNFSKCKALEQIAIPQIGTINTIKQSELVRIATNDNGSKKDSKNDK